MRYKKIILLCLFIMPKANGWVVDTAASAFMENQGVPISLAMPKVNGWVLDTMASAFMKNQTVPIAQSVITGLTLTVGLWAIGDGAYEPKRQSWLAHMVPRDASLAMIGLESMLFLSALGHGSIGEAVYLAHRLCSRGILNFMQNNLEERERLQKKERDNIENINQNIIEWNAQLVEKSKNIDALEGEIAQIENDKQKFLAAIAGIDTKRVLLNREKQAKLEGLYLALEGAEAEKKRFEDSLASTNAEIEVLTNRIDAAKKPINVALQNIEKIEHWHKNVVRPLLLGGFDVIIAAYLGHMMKHGNANPAWPYIAITGITFASSLGVRAWDESTAWSRKAISGIKSDVKNVTSQARSTIEDEAKKAHNAIESTARSFITEPAHIKAVGMKIVTYATIYSLMHYAFSPMIATTIGNAFASTIPAYFGWA